MKTSGVLLILFLTFSFNSKSQKAYITDNKQFPENPVFGKLKSLDLPDYSGFSMNTLYADTVNFVSVEDIGDYSRIHIEKDKKDYYFLNGLSSQNEEELVEGHVLLIYWQIVENNAPEDFENKYMDIAIKSFLRIGR